MVDFDPDNPLGIQEYTALTEDERAEYDDARLAHLRDAGEKQRREEATAAGNALSILAGDDMTADVALSPEVTVKVKKYASEEIENLIFGVHNATDGMTDVPPGAVSALKEDMAKIMAWLIDDEEYGRVELWRAYGREYGLSAMMERFFAIIEPRLDDMAGDDLDDETAEVIDTFRPE